MSIRLRLAVGFTVAILAGLAATGGLALAQPTAAAQKATAPAGTASGVRNFSEALTQGIGVGADQIKATKRLPVQGMSIIETTDGKVFVASDNGRIAIIGGRIIDLYESRQINGIADAESLDKINLRRMGVRPAELATFVIGTGPEQVTVFVDPVCEPCRRLVADMQSFARTHTFYVVLYPANGQAGQVARRITCSPDKALSLQAFIAGSYATLPEAARDCDVSLVQKGMITASVLGVRSVPFMIFSDGHTAYGSSVKLASALGR